MINTEIKNGIPHFIFLEMRYHTQQNDYAITNKQKERGLFMTWEKEAITFDSSKSSSLKAASFYLKMILQSNRPSVQLFIMHRSDREKFIDSHGHYHFKLSAPKAYFKCDGNLDDVELLLSTLLCESHDAF